MWKSNKVSEAGWRKTKEANDWMCENRKGVNTKDEHYNDWRIILWEAVFIPAWPKEIGIDF